MMYNFVSSSLPSSTTMKRSKSYAKDVDHSLIIHAPLEKTPAIRIGKLSEDNNVFLPNPSQKAYYSKSSRPPTSDIYATSPKRSSLAISRSQSPLGFGSPNTTLKSTATLFPQKSEKRIDSSVLYDGIKAQTRLFFSRGSTTEIPSSVPIQETIKKPDNISQPFTPMSSSRAYMSLTNRDNKFSSTAGCSPRKRLVYQKTKMYNTSGIRLKDAMKESLNALNKNRGDSRLSERKRSSDQAKKNKKKTPEEEASPALLALAKRMEEEKKVIESIGNASCEKFYGNLNLYNRYYAEYLHDPEVPFTAQNDLKVDVRTLIENTTATTARDAKRIDTKRVTLLPKGAGWRPSTNMKDLNMDENGMRTIPAKPFIVRNSVIDQKKKRVSSVEQQRAVEWSNVNEEELAEKPNESERWNLFRKDMVKVEDNLKSLEQMNILVGRRKELSLEEDRFMKAVKEGKEGEVEVLLKFNSDLVKIRDSRNQTPLHWAIKRFYPFIIGELYNYGADLEAIDLTGRKPLDLVQPSRKKEIMEIFEKKQWELKRKQFKGE